MAPSTSKFLICRSRPSICALPLDNVVETMRLLPIEPFAAMPAHVLGVSIIRGTPVPIVDAARLLGATDPVTPHRVVTLQVGSRRVGLAVEDVLDVRAIPAASLHDVPGLLDCADDSVVSAIAAADAQLLVVLRSAHLVPDDIWRTLDRERAP